MFTQTALSGDRVLVKGTDILGTQGQQVLDASEWNYIQRHATAHQAQDAFDAATREFFAPLTEAAKALEQALTPEQDELFTYVLHEAVEGVEGREADVVALSHDSAVLRLLSQSAQPSRLIWVNDQLEITAAPAFPTSPMVAPAQDDNQTF